ncbi:DUF4411 family protein [Rhizobium calliandrae]|uniref:DUF4411 family protein n=1 Tax=Rhizobium calliandrae TaxID=1312182 RepID=A0ABT7KMA5_9HYPH|nr:DUF4411 family protein [Rhizobium calliandrae]MDL2408379.1 DUF4411 family protein [Rhizobium calliandrae]
MQRVPEFWGWLVHMGETGALKIPLEILEEITEGSELAQWLKEGDNCDALKLDEDVDPTLVQAVIEKYAPDLNDAEIIEVGRDPFLIAHALAHRGDRIVVTVEASKPSTKRANRRIPDVCRDLDVRWCNSFQMLTELNFRTGWRAQL